MTTFLRLLLVGALVSAAACATSSAPPPPISDQQLCGFTVGRTSVDDVVRALGPPQAQVVSSDPAGALAYSYERLAEDRLQITRFHFDVGGILESVDREERGRAPVPIPSCLTRDGG
jgi:hypothetical protein